MKSASEEFCKVSFDTYLQKVIPASNRSWRDVEQKAEPPDYYLTLNSTLFAVEVTILIEKVNIGGKKHLPVSIIRDLLAKFVKDEVEAVARDKGHLRGTYVVIFSKPISNFANVQHQIQTELLSFISATQTTDKVPAKVIHKNGRQRCSIEKLDSQEDKIVMGGPVLSKRQVEALVTAKELLNNRLEEKKHSLRNISSPKILLLHDKYPFANRETYKTCVSELQSLQFFHTVFVVGSDHESEILYSQEPSWMLNS